MPAKGCGGRDGSFQTAQTDPFPNEINLFALLLLFFQLIFSSDTTEKSTQLMKQDDFVRAKVLKGG